MLITWHPWYFCLWIGWKVHTACLVRSCFEPCRDAGLNTSRVTLLCCSEYVLCRFYQYSCTITAGNTKNGIDTLYAWWESNPGIQSMTSPLLCCKSWLKWGLSVIKVSDCCSCYQPLFCLSRIIQRQSFYRKGSAETIFTLLLVRTKSLQISWSTLRW